VEITLRLVLPPDEISIPMARRISRQALREVGVDGDCGHDIEVALSEACTNVLKHAGLGREYEVLVSINADNCTISVLDTGSGFDAGASPGSEPMGETGRGIELMRALVDSVDFESKPDTGTIVHLRKRLALRHGSLAVGRASTDEPAEGRSQANF
jgi:serine/threonine-protein kinase RsbW